MHQLKFTVSDAGLGLPAKLENSPSAVERQVQLRRSEAVCLYD